MRRLLLRLRVELEPIESVDARNTRLPFATSASDAPLSNVKSSTVALAERLTELAEMSTGSLGTGTPLGLQLEAVDQLPPLTAPTKRFALVSSSMIVPTACASAMVALLAPVRLTKNVSFDSLVVSPFTSTLSIWLTCPGTK